MLKIKDHIIINRSIVHILDNSIEVPVLSDFECQRNEEIDDFLSNHIKKVFNGSDLKKTVFESDNNMIIKDAILGYNAQSISFVEVSKQIAEKIKLCMQEALDIPSSDLVVLDFNYNDLKYLGVIKFNYKNSYIHAIKQHDEGIENYLIKQKTAIASDNQIIEECFFVDLSKFNIYIKEKKFTFDSAKVHYLSKNVLNVKDSFSDKEKVNIVTNVSKKLIKEYYDDITQIGKAKQIMTESIEDGNEIDLEEIGERIFPASENMQVMYVEKIKEKGINNKILSINNSVIKKSNRTQKIVTEDGIEIIIPVSYISDRDKVEFISNQDGSVSIILKNLSNIKDK